MIVVPAHRLDREIEIGGNRRVGQIATAGDRDDITLELCRELPRQDDIVPARHRRAFQMSTKSTPVTT